MAALIDPMLAEFREEVPAIRRMLERIPDDKLGWKPHAKSKSLGELAMHVANLPGLAERIASFDEFSPTIAPPAPVKSAEEIRAAFERNAAAAEEVLSRMTDERASGEWRLVIGGRAIARKSRVAALRTNMLNHIYHHRGQLSVYLRLLDVPLPIVYGPTADENPFM